MGCPRVSRLACTCTAISDRAVLVASFTPRSSFLAMAPVGTVDVAVAIQFSGHLRDDCRLAPAALHLSACRSRFASCHAFVHTWTELEPRTPHWRRGWPSAANASSAACVRRLQSLLQPTAVVVEEQPPPPPDDSPAPDGKPFVCFECCRDDRDPEACQREAAKAQRLHWGAARHWGWRMNVRAMHRAAELRRAHEARHSGRSPRPSPQPSALGPEPLVLGLNLNLTRSRGLSLSQSLSPFQFDPSTTLTSTLTSTLIFTLIFTTPRHAAAAPTRSRCACGPTTSGATARRRRWPSFGIACSCCSPRRHRSAPACRRGRGRGAARRHVARRRAARQSATAPRGLRRRGSTWTTRCAVRLEPRELGAAALGRRGCRPVRQRLPPHG